MHRVELPGEHGRRLGALEEVLSVYMYEKCRLRRKMRKRVNILCSSGREKKGTAQR